MVKEISNSGQPAKFTKCNDLKGPFSFTLGALLPPIAIGNLSCYLEEVEASSKDEQSQFEFKTLRCDSMDVFWE